MRVIGWLLVLVIGAAAAVTIDLERLAVLDPDLAGATVTYPVSQVIGLRPLVVIVFVVLAIIMFVIGVVRRIGFRGGTKTMTLAVVFLLVAGGHAWVLWDRGLTNPEELTVDDGVRPDGPGNGGITVLAYNVLDGRTSAEDIAALASENGVDVLALSEVTRPIADQVASTLAASGTPFQVFVGGSDDDATALLVSSALGEYIHTDAPVTRHPAVRADPASGVGPVLVAVHPWAPTPEDRDQWLDDLEAVNQLCSPRTTPGVVVAGDFNATLDHAPMQKIGECVDAATEAGVGGVATWPTRTPEWLGSAIDHVLVDGSRYEVTEAAVAERGGSDHRAVLARIVPREPAG